jgi:hypothetical protein
VIIRSITLNAGVVKSVNTADLKSADLTVLAVQVRPPAPSVIKGLALLELSLLFFKVAWASNWASIFQPLKAPNSHTKFVCNVSSIHRADIRRDKNEISLRLRI